MKITEREIKLVQSTWKIFEPIAETAAELFYERLFNFAPEVEHLFQEETKNQGRRIMKMIEFIVNELSNIEESSHSVLDMNRKRVKFEMEESHFIKVGAALLWTLQQGLGVAFDAEVKAAWTRVYIIVSTTAMINAAKQSVAVAGD